MHNMALENCPDTRWAWVEISRSALRHNITTLRKHIPDRCHIMAVLKADAYGHGALECAKLFKTGGATQFGVATVQEGVALRKKLTQDPILILNEPPVTAIPLLLEHRLMPSIHSAEFALAYGEAAASQGTKGEYHLAIDTGMTRNGVDWRDVVELRNQLDFHRGLACAGTFTHFATADKADDWDFELQHNRFKEALTALHEANYDLGIVHAANTAASILHPETHYDMVRLGVGLLGMYPDARISRRLELKPAMSVHGRVTRTTCPAVGAGVSYGMTYRVKKSSTQIATVPLGYADGYKRALSGRTQVICNGRLMQQVGSICMDHFMFAHEINMQRQFGPTYPVNYGDEVIVMGADDAGNAVTAEDLAALINTINYEVTCDFGLRLERVYV